MIPPKYKFYILKGLNGYIYTGYVVNESTGELSSGFDSVHAVTDLLSVVNYDIIKLITTQYNSCYLHEYDKDSNYIGNSTIKDSIITLSPTTCYIRIQFYLLNTSITDLANIIAAGYSVNPHYKELSKKYAKENEQEFFRTSLEGKITLFSKDYEHIKKASLEDQFIFIINKYNKTSGIWQEYYRGEFNKADCKFNYENKACELKINALDAYNNVLNKYENTYDLIKLAPAITKINLHKRSLMQVYVRGANSISNFFGGIYWESDINEAVDSDSDLINKYYFAYVKAGNEFYIKDASISEVNGVYAGTNGYWSKWDPGYTCKMELADDSTTWYWLNLYRNSDNTLLYRSERQWQTMNADNKYVGREDIKMVNVNNSNDTFTIESPFVYHIYSRLLCDVDTVEDSGGVKNTYDLPIDDFVTDNRNYKKCIGLKGGMFFCTSRAVDGPTRYGINDYGQYFTSEFIPLSAGIGRPLPISRNSWANASLWYVYDDSYSLIEQKLRKKYTLKDSYSIASVIKALLKEVDPSLKHEATSEYSHFLYDSTVPIQMDRFYVYLAPKTNVLKGEYDQPAKKAEVSLEDVMKMLRDCFRCYWYIEDNKFKIEHISFFMNGGSYSYNADIQLNFAALADQFNKKRVSYFQSEIEYDKTDLSQRYEFNWMDDVTDLFGGLTIDIKSNYIQKDKTEEINISNFSSDVDYMLFNPSNFSEDGFALLCPIEKDSELELPIIETQLVDENNNTYSAIVQNFYASWAYLVHFYMYDMPAKNIKCNVLNNLYVRAVKRCMEHSIELPIEEDPNTIKLIKTTIGDGKINEVSININTRYTKVKLAYEP